MAGHSGGVFALFGKPGFVQGEHGVAMIADALVDPAGDVGENSGVIPFAVCDEVLQVLDVGPVDPIGDGFGVFALGFGKETTEVVPGVGGIDFGSLHRA